MDIYGVITVVAFVFMLIFLPNRKGKPLLEGLKAIDEEAAKGS
jgi:hypothetical protein